MFASNPKFVSAETKSLYELATAFAKARNLSLRTVSRKAANQGMFFDRIADEKDCSTARRRRVVQWFSDHWPVREPWPAGIKRPARNKQREAA
jgi:hypothetical protein